ncbi:Gmad2 immunoglobulin-like domain-containing protein [Nocardioides sp.]|uniref:Gmad2 immunoglobulin-like domain-containing protein n=1 Tax=Nocardioides sp. TaxID=35761 RepID=UPI00356895D2
MDDRELATLLNDAVADIEPDDRLTEIRAAVRPARRQRIGWYAAGGASLAVAAAVTAVAVLTTPSTPRAEDPGPVGPPTTSQTPSTPTEPTIAAGVYYVGDTPSGPRLYREITDIPGADRMNAALLLTAQAPADPDYRTLWPSGSLVRAGFNGVGDDGSIYIVVADSELADRPESMSADEARLTVQSVVYTMQELLGTRARVEFYTPEGEPMDTVLGVQADRDPEFAGIRSFTSAPVLETLSLVQVSTPSEGQVVSGSFTANGAASSFEGNVPWQLLDSSGAVVRNGFATAGMDQTLIPWETEPIDVSDLPPGSYTFRASTDDPSGGEGPGAFTDTRTVVVE